MKLYTSDHKYEPLQLELNSCQSKILTETYTENRDVIAEIRKPKKVSIVSPNLLFVHCSTSSFFLQLQQSWHSSPLLVKNIIMFINKDLIPDGEFQVL